MLPIGCVTPGFLSEDTDDGLFYATTPNSAGTRFLVGDGGSIGWLALSLDAFGQIERFTGWPLRKGDTQIGGYSIGPCEVLINPMSGHSTTLRTAGFGDALVRSDGIYIVGRPDRPGQAVPMLKLREAQPGNTDKLGASFRHWQLVQRDHSGQPVVLFDSEKSGA